MVVRMLLKITFTKKDFLPTSACALCEYLCTMSMLFGLLCIIAPSTFSRTDETRQENNKRKSGLRHWHEPLLNA